MARIKMDDFKRNRGSKTEGQLESESPLSGDQTKESSVASPMIGGRSKTAGAIKKTERKSLVLPISGSSIELTAVEVDPSECLVHPRNQRVQALLKLENPKVASLKESLETEHQREPALGRWILSNGKRTLEILDGSRRRFVSEMIRRENPEFTLKVWVGSIADADADYLAKAGNDEREDISPWERAQWFKQVENENPDWSHEVIAAHEKVSRQTVTNHLAIADIPLEIIELLETPDLLKVTTGLQVVRLIREVKDQKYLEELRKNAPFRKFSDLAKSLKSSLDPKQNVELPAVNRKIEIKSGKKLKASIGINRKVKGQYKVDLYEIDDNEYEKVLDALKSIFK